MFQNSEVSEIIESSSTVSTQSQVIAEWNLNTFENIKKIGNYRYRPEVASPSTANYGVIAPTFDSADLLYAYTGATDSDIVTDGGYNENNIPQVFLSQDVKKSLLYSLEDCFHKSRPRSGINKILYFEGKKINVFSKDMFQRPRYYMSTPEDKFKYWTSYRKEVAGEQEKVAISKIKFSQATVGSTTQTTATYTTNTPHTFNEADTITIKDRSSNSFNFLPKTYTINSVPSSTTFTVIESNDVYQELSGDIIGSGGLSIEVSGLELNDIVAYVTRLSAEYGLSYVGNSSNPINDAAPFVVYENTIPANRIIVKMQTNVGKVDAGLVTNELGTYDDPFYGDDKKTVPSDWKIQYLNKSNAWVDLDGNGEKLSLDETVVGPDGYLQLSYGLIVPDEYRDIFIYAGDKLSDSAVPEEAPNGYAYLVRSGTQQGTFHIYVDGNWETFVPVYGWQPDSDEPTRLTNYVTDMVNPEYYLDGQSRIYRELQEINGLRIVVAAMNVPDCTFDLIELSPRLAVDLTGKTSSLSVHKGSSDIGNNGLLVNNIVVSNGSLELFDYDNAFGEYNDESILNVKDSVGNIKYSIASKNLQVKIYDIIYNDNGAGFHIPIKTLYSDGFPDTSSKDRSVSITLRDGFSFFESMTAPELLFSSATMSFIVASLMDSIGFTNYIFKRIDGKSEPVIPYFFVKPNMTIAQVLEALGVSTQTAIFFDEYNNLVFMSKEYMMPDASDREIDHVFRGSKDYAVSADGIVRNAHTSNSLSDIIEISSRDEEIYNDGKITYSTRSVLKNMPNTVRANARDQDKNWTYQNALLWEVAPEARTKPINDDNGVAQGYTLSAVALNSVLSSSLPTTYVANVTAATLSSLNREITYTCNNSLSVGDIVTVTNFTDNLFNVSNFRVKSATATTFKVDSRYKKTMTSNIVGQIQDGRVSKVVSIKNNIMDFGESVVWMGRYKGYFYANGEIIRYDAIEYSVSGIGLVWITSPLEYKNFFAKMTFGGNIYATGRVRIYSEPKYQDGEIKAGDVAKHGRGQFGTQVVTHNSGLSSHWLDNANKGACKMESSYLFNASTSIPVTSKTGTAGSVAAKYYPSTSGVIKNVLSANNVSEKELSENRVVDGSLQSSALVLGGPSFEAGEEAIKYISYVTKTLDKRYNHFGTRLRIIGEPGTSDNPIQQPLGSMTYQTTNGTSTGTTVTVAGSSAGLAIMNDKATNIGYYLELVALNDNSLVGYSNANAKIYNIFFYKIERGVYDPTDNYPTGTDAFPIPLWAGKTPVFVDDGKFAGQYKKTGESLPTVYDLAVEYTEQPDGSLQFYIFLNNKVIANITDTAPIPTRPNCMSVFVRGKSKAMFENVYALSIKETADSTKALDAPVESVFGYDSEKASDALFKYGISSMIRDTYLSGITLSGTNKYNLYFEEFGTIMRELSYMDVKYDKAYPALYAKMMPTFSSFQNYVVSGFVAGPYGAKFLVFNTTDTLLDLNLDSGTAYLRIGGVSFTSQSDNYLSVDDYFIKHASLAEQEIDSSGGIANIKGVMDYNSIKQSRLQYGKKDFNLNATYIQSTDAAEEMMGWMISKMMKPRKLIGISMFSNPTLQLGDIATIDYIDQDGNHVVAMPDERFVVYHIQYERRDDGPSMTVFLSEVI